MQPVQQTGQGFALVAWAEEVDALLLSGLQLLADQGQTLHAAAQLQALKANTAELIPVLPLAVTAGAATLCATQALASQVAKVNFEPSIHATILFILVILLVSSQ